MHQIALNKHDNVVFLQLTNPEIDVALSSTEDKLRGSDGAAARGGDQTTCGAKVIRWVFTEHSA